VRALFGDDLSLVVDGGSSSIGVESTVVDLTGEPPVILRHGAISPSELEAALGRPLGSTDSSC
jgi:L-threonylcarbamoyladenylate synthase